MLMIVVTVDVCKRFLFDLSSVPDILYNIGYEITKNSNLKP